MSSVHELAKRYHCCLSVEAAHPRFGRTEASFTVVLTVNSGYE